MAELHCAGCGAPGHAPVIVWERGKEPLGAVLRCAFGFHGRPALVCEPCRDVLRTQQGKSRVAGD
jgi:hypothetical protein